VPLGGLGTVAASNGLVSTGSSGRRAGVSGDNPLDVIGSRYLTWSSQDR
jgi:hypothetical protein